MLPTDRANLYRRSDDWAWTSEDAIAPSPGDSAPPPRHCAQQDSTRRDRSQRTAERFRLWRWAASGHRHRSDRLHTIRRPLAVQGRRLDSSYGSFEGRLAVHRGALRIRLGASEGPIAVANGTLYLLPGAEVDGDILVVGGETVRRGHDTASWHGAVYTGCGAGVASCRRRLALKTAAFAGELATARTSFQTGQVQTTLTLGTAGTYNRIEGLPIFFSPAFEYRPARGTVLRAGGPSIVRTAGDAGSRNDLGYNIRTEMRVLGATAFGVEGRVLRRCRARSKIIRSPPSEIGWSAVLSSNVTTVTISNARNRRIVLRGAGQATPDSRSRCGATRGDRWAADPGRCWNYRPVAAQSADRRRAFYHGRHRRRLRYPQLAGISVERMAHPRPLRAFVEQRRRAGHVAGLRYGRRSRSAAATRSTACRWTYATTSGLARASAQRARTDRWLDHRRPAADATPCLARRSGSPTRLLAPLPVNKPTSPTPRHRRFATG